MMEILNYLRIIIEILMNSVTILIIFRVALPNKKPMDESNRISHIRIIWWAINAPEKFVGIFEWLTKDEGENLNG